MKRNIPRDCNAELIDQLHDDELAPEERKAVIEHLNTCASCQGILKDSQILSKLFRDNVDDVLSRTDLRGLDEKILDRIAKRPAGKLRRLFLSKPFIIPASAVAAVVLVFFTFFTPQISDPGPSALINSFTGRISSVMIIETPNTRHTILWFAEETTPTGNENAAPKS
jgi:hypothetical protein